MSIVKQIQLHEWQDRLQSFTTGNKGRHLSILVDGESLVENQPFEDISYDPPGKGNDLFIKVKGSTHTVSNPLKLTLIEENNGIVSALEINDKNGSSTVLTFSV